MTPTEKLLAVIAAAKVRADVVPHYLPHETGWTDIDYRTVNAAIVSKWSWAGLHWIKQQAWKEASRA